MCHFTRVPERAGQTARDDNSRDRAVHKLVYGPFLFRGRFVVENALAARELSECAFGNCRGNVGEIFYRV